MSEIDFVVVLKSVGLFDGLVDMLVDFDVGVLKGGLFDDSKMLSKLIGCLMIMLVESVSYFFNVNK